MLLHDFSPQHAQGLFGHHPMMGPGGSGMPPPDHIHDKNGVIGLNLVPSDFGQGNMVGMLPPTPQMKQQSYYLQSSSASSTRNPSPVKSSGAPRPSSPVGTGAEPPASSGSASNESGSGDGKPNAQSSTSFGRENAGAPDSEREQQPQPQQEGSADKSAGMPMPGTESSKATHDQDIDMDASTPRDLPPRDDKQLEVNRTTGDAGPSAEPSPVDTPTESRRSVDSEKRPHSDTFEREAAASGAGSASSSPQKRQRVIV
jgi:hypothetical protein